MQLNRLNHQPQGDKVAQRGQSMTGINIFRNINKPNETMLQDGLCV